MMAMTRAMEEHLYMKKLLGAKLADATKKQYRHKLLGLVGMMNKDFDWIIDHPEQVVEAVYDTHDQEQTRKAYIAAVKALFKYNDDIRGKHPGMFDKWHEAYTKVDETIKTRYINQEVTQKEQENWVTWEDVLRKENELSLSSYGSRDHLLLAMYCLAEAPLRQDFAAVKVYRSVPEDELEGNYIVLSGSERRLVLNDYKTSRSHGKLEQALPEKLVRVIEASLTRTPREYLFLSAKNEPYSDDSYTKMANRVLEEVFGKRVTVSMLRHSFINTRDFNDTRGVFKTAKLMGHTVEEHMLYKKKVV